MKDMLDFIYHSRQLLDPRTFLLWPIAMMHLVLNLSDFHPYLHFVVNMYISGWLRRTQQSKNTSFEEFIINLNNEANVLFVVEKWFKSSLRCWFGARIAATESHLECSSLRNFRNPDRLRSPGVTSIGHYPILKRDVHGLNCSITSHFTKGILWDIFSFSRSRNSKVSISQYMP